MEDRIDNDFCDIEDCTDTPSYDCFDGFESGSDDDYW